MITPGRGAVLGKAPYRHYDSTPSQKLFDRIIRSLRHAQSELVENNLTEESHTLAKSIQDSKSAAEAGNFSLATQSIFNGLRKFHDIINSNQLAKSDPKGSA